MKSSRIFKGILPVILIAGGVVGAVAMVKLKPKPVQSVPEKKAMMVRVQDVVFEEQSIWVESQGTVRAKNRGPFMAEVAGTVMQIAENFQPGSSFKKGDVLVELDPFDFEQNVIATKAEVASSKVRYLTVQAESDRAKKEWENSEIEPSPLALFLPQLEEAKAQYEAAQARLLKAERDLGKTKIVAPYDGRVLDEQVEIGQRLSPGAMLGTIYQEGELEILLPVSSDELQFLALPQQGEKVRVELEADLGGQTQTFSAHLVRIEGQIDRQSRMVPLLAKIEISPDNPFLLPGLFVKAKIQGVQPGLLATLPRSSLRREKKLYVLDDQNTLQFRQPEIFRVDRTQILIEGGLEDGARVITSPLEFVTEGMALRVFDEGQE